MRSGVEADVRMQAGHRHRASASAVVLSQPLLVRQSKIDISSRTSPPALHWNMFTLLRDDADGGDVPQRKKKLRPEPVMELDKLRITVLSFKNIQFTNDDIDSDDDDDSMDEDDHDKAKYRRVISAHVGIRPVPSRRETVRIVPTSSSKISSVYPPSEGYSLSLGAVEKELVYFKDRKDRTNEVGTAFHWCDTTNIDYSILWPPDWNRQRYHHTEYMNCSPTPHLEIERRVRDDHETVIDFQVCVMVWGEDDELDGPSSYACCHGFGQYKFTGSDARMIYDSPGGLVAIVTITKRKAPSFFPNIKKSKLKNGEGLRFSRGSSLLIRIEREESFEREQRKQQWWRKYKIGRYGEVNHQQESVGSYSADTNLSSNAQRGGAAEMQQLSTLQNVEHVNQRNKHRSSGEDHVHRNDKDVDNIQQSGVTSNQVSCKTEQQLQQRHPNHDVECVHGSVKENVENSQDGTSRNINANKSLPNPSKKVPHAEGRKMPTSAAQLGGPTNQLLGKPQDQHIMMQQPSVHSTEETHRKQRSMDSFDSDAACRALLGVSHSLQGVTTTARPSGRNEKQQQLNILGGQSSVDGSASTIARDKSIDVASEPHDGKSRKDIANESAPESSKKAPDDDEGRKMLSSAAPLGDLPPQQQTVQQLAVQSTKKSHCDREPMSKDSCNAEAKCSELNGVSDSMQGVTTTARLSGQSEEHNHQRLHQPNILGSQSSVDGSESVMTSDKPIDFVSERERVPVSDQQLRQLENFTFWFDESVKRMLENVNGLKRAREESNLMEEHMSLLLRLQLDAMPTMRDSITVPFLPTNQNMVMQISMVQSQLQAFLQRVRISRAWIDFEYEKQMMSMQQLMASYSQMIVLMNEGAGGVKPNEETVAAK